MDTSMVTVEGLEKLEKALFVIRAHAGKYDDAFNTSVVTTKIAGSSHSTMLAEIERVVMLDALRESRRDTLNQTLADVRLLFGLNIESFVKFSQNGEVDVTNIVDAANKLTSLQSDYHELVEIENIDESWHFEGGDSVIELYPSEVELFKKSLYNLRKEQRDFNTATFCSTMGIKPTVLCGPKVRLGDEIRKVQRQALIDGGYLNDSPTQAALSKMESQYPSYPYSVG